MRTSKLSHWKSGVAVLAFFAHGVLWGDCWFLNGSSILTAKATNGSVRGVTSRTWYPGFVDPTSKSTVNTDSNLTFEAVTTALTTGPFNAGFHPPIN